jgi:RNA polymerase sigma-70 factor (ECF subfamily)
MSSEHEQKPKPAHITFLIERVREGDEAARADLFEAVYAQLRRIAAHYLRREAVGHSLQPTALVHEAYIRMAGGAGDLKNTGHFFAVASQAMRHLLVDHARAKRGAKRWGGRKVSLTETQFVYTPQHPELMLALDGALTKLETKAPRQCRVVEMRFFGGLSEDEIASVLGVNVRTVKRDWTFAKAWLYDQIA